jgi:hypothetical protein
MGPGAVKVETFDLIYCSMWYYNDKNLITQLMDKKTTPSVSQYKDRKSSIQETIPGGNDLYTPHFTLPTNSPTHLVLSYPFRSLYFGTKFEPSKSLYIGTEGVPNIGFTDERIFYTHLIIRSNEELDLDLLHATIPQSL